MMVSNRKEIYSCPRQSHHTTFQRSGGRVIGSGYRKSRSNQVGPCRLVSTRRHRRPTACSAKRVHLDQVPDRAPARVTADSRYALFVNGQEVFRGPIRSQPRRLHYDLFDLAPYLQPGENVLAVYVKYYGTPKSYWMPAAPNLTLGKTGILVFEANLGAAGWLVSDASWKARKADAWSDDWRNDIDDPVGGGVPVEIFDARRFPHDWRDAGFDDSGWGAAQVVPAMHIGGFAHTQPPTDPYGPLYPRPIAHAGRRKSRHPRQSGRDVAKAR